jgi:hypothetical protein
MTEKLKDLETNLRASQLQGDILSERKESSRILENIVVCKELNVSYESHSVKYLESQSIIADLIDELALLGVKEKVTEKSVKDELESIFGILSSFKG